MLGAYSISSAPISSRPATAIAFYAEANGAITGADAASFLSARVRAAAGGMTAADAAQFRGNRIAQSGFLEGERADLFLDGVVFEAGGFSFDMPQRANVSFAGGAIRCVIAAASQTAVIGISAVRIVAAATAAIQGISPAFRAAMVVTATGSSSPSAIFGLPAAAIRAGGMTAVQRAVVTFIASKLVESLADYSMKRPLEFRGMLRPLEQRTMRVPTR